MLNEAVVEGFLDCRFEDMELEFPRIYPNNALVGIFCQYVAGVIMNGWRMVSSLSLTMASTTGSG